MHPLVEHYIETKKIENKKRKEEEKRAKLIELGIYEKRYADPEANWSPEYPEFDAELSRCFKKVPIEVSDEEFEEILKVSEAPKKQIIKSSSCGTSSWLIFVAIVIFFVFFILGIDMGMDSVFTLGNNSDFSFGTACIFWFIGIINGSIFIALAKIIDLLHKKD